MATPLQVGVARATITPPDEKYFVNMKLVYTAGTAPPATASVSGTVREASTNAGLANVAVQLQSGGQIVLETKSGNDGSYALLALDKVEGADMSKISEQERAALKVQMVKAYGSEAAQEFVEALRKGSDIEIAKDRL